MRTIRCGLAAMAMALAIVAPASALTEEERWDRCLQQDKVGPLEPEEVIEACRFVLGMDFIPPNVRNDAFNNIGVAHARMGNMDEAIRAYGDALRKLKELPDIPEVRQLANYTRHNRALAYIKTKQYDKALTDIDRMAATEVKADYFALKCFAHALYDDAFTSALADCQKAIDTDPQKAGYAYAGFLIVEFRQGKYEDVKNDCKLIGDKMGMSPDALYVCGLTEQRSGNAKLALGMLQLARSMGESVSERFKELGLDEQGGAAVGQPSAR